MEELGMGPAAPRPSLAIDRRLAIVVTVGGGVLMALEILASRVLAPHFGSSVYVWGSIISVFLAALSVGYVWGGRLADRDPTLVGLGRQVAWAALAQAVLLVIARPACEWLADATGHTTWGTLLTTAALFGIPSVFIGVISPYAVRLRAANIDQLGGTVGHLYALSTFGSLAGTLGCTFVLVPFLTLNRGMALLLALTAAVAALALAGAFRREWMATLVVLVSVGLAGRSWLLHQPTTGGRLLEKVTPYQTIQVHETPRLRFLTSDRAVHGVLDRTTGHSWASYARVAVTALAFRPEIDSMLVLGLGAGQVGRDMQRYLVDLEVDNVEIDPGMLEVARDHFGFVEGPKTRVFIQDGRRFVDEAERKWDYIYNDTYIGLSVPFHLTTREFLLAVRNHLHEGGIFGLNLAGNLESPFPRAIYRTVREVFPNVWVYRVPSSANLLVLATTGPRPNDLELRERAAKLDAQYHFDIPIAEVLASPVRGTIDLSEAPVLSDNFAPVDHLLNLSAPAVEFPE